VPGDLSSVRLLSVEASLLADGNEIRSNASLIDSFAVPPLPTLQNLAGALHADAVRSTLLIGREVKTEIPAMMREVASRPADRALTLCWITDAE
jgi:hypothetical protein